MADFDYGLLLITIAGGIFVGVVSSLIVQLIIKWFEKKGIISDMKEAIKQEIEENILGLKDEDTTSSMEGTTMKSEEILLETASYDSSVKSGNFILLPRELRKGISNLYAYIYIANFHIDQVIKSQFTLFTDETKEKYEIMESYLNYR